MPWLCNMSCYGIDSPDNTTQTDIRYDIIHDGNWQQIGEGPLDSKESCISTYRLALQLQHFTYQTSNYVSMYPINLIVQANKAQFAQNMAVSLSCSVKIFKTLGQVQWLWLQNYISHNLSLRWVLVGYFTLPHSYWWLVLHCSIGWHLSTLWYYILAWSSSLTHFYVTTPAPRSYVAIDDWCYTVVLADTSPPRGITS